METDKTYWGTEQTGGEKETERERIKEREKRCWWKERSGVG
jgi:hypothetical protein